MILHKWRKLNSGDMATSAKLRALDLEEGSKLSSRDIEPNPKLDSAQFFYQNPKLDYALSNCGQLLTDPKLDSLDLFIESSYK